MEFNSGGKTWIFSKVVDNVMARKTGPIKIDINKSCDFRKSFLVSILAPWKFAFREKKKQHRRNSEAICSFMLACLGTVDVRQEYTFRILSLELEMPICRSLAFFYVFKPKIFHAHRMRPTGTHSYSIHFGSHLFPSQISTYLFAYDFVVVCVFFFLVRSFFFFVQITWR